jgi:intein-encoded DNA endonuclease-like protein
LDGFSLVNRQTAEGRIDAERLRVQRVVRHLVVACVVHESLELELIRRALDSEGMLRIAKRTKVSEGSSRLANLAHTPNDRGDTPGGRG